MTKEYVPISYSEFHDRMVSINAVQKNISGCYEHVYEIPVITRSNKSYPYKIRIYSSIDIETGVSRECGEDAIRIMLVNSSSDRPLRVEKRVNRVGNEVLKRVVDRSRDLFKYAINQNHHCPKCGSLLVTRKNKDKKSFIGCSSYPDCKYTKEGELSI